MKVLVIGAGGREHALAWALKKSERVKEIVCAPGNGGMAALARCVPAKLNDVNDLLRVVAAERPDLTVVGPEIPLSLGLVDELRLREMAVFGPTQAAAMLETSKSFAKRFMQRHNIPTAAYAVCASEQEALETLGRFHLPVVIKADGLQAGKGVLICGTKAEAEQAITGLFSGKLLGSAETTVVLEEFLTGEELSFLVLSDGKHVAPLAPAQDHKRLGEGDTGPNTGGMGVYSTDAMLDATMLDWLLHHVAQPTIDGMAAEDAPFTGVLYCGLMMTAKGPMVLEYNARFGDPETQAILARLDSDLLEGLEACVEGRLSEAEFRWKPGASACVVAASGGYPGSYTNGHKITGLKEAAKVPEVVVFHAGTALVDGEILTNGGRVLGVTATGNSLPEALARAYEGIGKIGFGGIYYRRDIGHRAGEKVRPLHCAIPNNSLYRDMVQSKMMIASFRDEWLRAFFEEDKPSRKIPAELSDRLFRKLQMLDDAETDADLRVPPSNHFEKLKGSLEGRRSIRVSGRWRLIFGWEHGEARDVYLDDHSYR